MELHRAIRCVVRYNLGMVRRIRQWFVNLAISASGVREMMRRASDAIHEARTAQAESERAMTMLSDEVRFQSLRMSERMQEMLDLRLAEVACVAPDKARGFAESWRGQASHIGMFKERLWELELALEDRGWVREQAWSALEFSRYGVGQLIRICRIYALKNPLIKRGAEICSLYVFGRGVEIRSEDDTADKAIQEFVARNSAELGHVGLAQKEQAAQTDGNLCFGLETKGSQVTVHMIDPLEILEVVTDPDDSSKDWFYRRQWMRENFSAATGTQSERMEAWYPSVEMAMDQSAKIPPSIKDIPVNRDMPILRVKVGAPAKWRWGIPPLYASLDWARSYKSFLEDWATVQRNLARFALMVETSGGPGAIAAYQALMSTTFGNSDGTQIERNPPPVAGSAHIAGPDNKITAFKSAGAQVAPEQARRLLLMVCAAHGLPETFYGDASTGSLATAVSLDRPTELKFKEIQQRWKDTLMRLLEYVLLVSEKSPLGKMREARAKNPAPQRAEIIVKFPAVLEHDIGVMVKAITDVATLGGRQGIAAGMVDRRTIAEMGLSEVGVENVDEKLDAMGYGEGYDPEADVIDQRTQVSPQQLVKPATGQDKADAKDRKDALKTAAEALHKLAGLNGR